MFVKIIDSISNTIAWLSKLALIILTIAMLYEVVARYVFNSSTIWAFDISYMATGVAFILGIAWTAKVDGHVRVDAFSSLLPPRFSRIINGVAYTFAVFPIFSLIAWHGWKKAWNSIQSGEVEMVSTWAPKMWPFYTCIAFGLSIFALQVLVIGLKAIATSKTNNEIK